MSDKLTINFVKEDGQWHCRLGSGVNSEGIPFETFNQFLGILLMAEDKLNETTDPQ